MIGQVLLAPSAVDVHYRHFGGMIAHPFVICLLTSFVYSPFIATLLNLQIIFRISQSKATKRKLEGPLRGARRRHRRLEGVYDVRAILRQLHSFGGKKA